MDGVDLSLLPVGAQAEYWQSDAEQASLMQTQRLSFSDTAHIWHADHLRFNPLVLKGSQMDDDVTDHSLRSLDSQC